MNQALPTRSLNRFEDWTDLEDGPENSWLGYDSLAKQGVDIKPDFATYIDENKPLWFTDPKVSFIEKLSCEKYLYFKHIFASNYYQFQ